MDYSDLSKKEKEWYKNKCKIFIGTKLMGAYLETGQPIYFDEHGNFIKFEILYSFLKQNDRKEKLKKLIEFL